MKVKARRMQVSAALGIAFLALAVFGWGLQYKLSLYDQSSDLQNSIPHAKLLSQKERPASSTAIGLIGSNTPQPRLPASCLVLFVGIALLGSSAVQFSWARNRVLVSYSAQQRSAASNYFAFRPPPRTPLSY
jgi:hypothetical protein